MTKQTIILAAGGTGGHLFPACSLAATLIDSGYNVLMLTDKRGETFIGKFERHIPYKVIQSDTIGAGAKGKLLSVIRISIGLFQSLGILLYTRGKAVVAFGGYPCFPPALAAGILRIPVILHEQNALLGRANRVLARFANIIATSFSNVESVPSAIKNKIRYTGNPLRRDILTKVANFTYTIPCDNKPFRLLVVGGSQGAKILSDIVPAAIALLPEKLRNNLIITQQTRPETLENLKSQYGSMNFAETPIITPFITNMAETLIQSHLVITRAGASTVSELTAFGIPAIYVPLAQSLDGDQAQNAKGVVDVGGGWMMIENNFTAQALAKKIEQLITEPNILQTTANHAKELGNTHASENLLALVETALRGEK